MQTHDAALRLAPLCSLRGEPPSQSSLDSGHGYQQAVPLPDVGMCCSGAAAAIPRSDDGAWLLTSGTNLKVLFPRPHCRIPGYLRFLAFPRPGLPPLSVLYRQPQILPAHSFAAVVAVEASQS